ncbi:MAG: hypothetical protein VX899_09305, partial [Myxococcota bacterium]|nr:hypothetical protein [Myxococcota bacterium]
MFDSVGRARKVNRKRQTGAAMMSVLLLLTVASTSLLTGGQIVEELESEAVEIEFMEAMEAPP